METFQVIKNYRRVLGDKGIDSKMSGTNMIYTTSVHGMWVAGLVNV